MTVRSKKILVWAIVLVGVAVAANIILYLFKASPFNLADIHLQKSISSSDVTAIQVLSNSGDVKVEPYNGTEIQATLKGKSERKWVGDYVLEVKKEGTEVRVEANQKERKRLLSFSKGSYQVVVRLPRKGYEQFHVQTITANINVEGIQTDQAVLETVNGNITSSNLEGKLVGRAEVGDIWLHAQEITKDIEARTKLGNVTVTVKEAPAALRTDLNAGMGKKTVDLPNVENGSIGNGGPQVVLFSEVGDLALVRGDK